uniref:Uncharacterized protein n=1 Tax=Schistocephalus solidus TaxID=70667 RepID=A0A0X3NM72_SCHSO
MMDPIYDQKEADVEFSKDISSRMQVPNRLSLAFSDFPSNEDISVMEIPHHIVIGRASAPTSEFSIGKKPTENFTRPSLEPPPETMVLGHVTYPSVDRINHRRVPTGPLYSSDVSLFRNLPCDGAEEDVLDKENPHCNNSASSDDTATVVAMAPTLDAQMQDLLLRITALEAKVKRHSRHELILLFLVSTYFLLKLSNSMFRT